ncbi:meiotic nuclear division protein 1, partial [Dichomitus squalens]
FTWLKEIEKMAPKMKEIAVSQSVKGVLQSLVDDGLVQMDRIGSSNFFWSFTS